MSDLKSFVALQARLFEFLEQQDEATLLAIAGGAAQLAVLDAGKASTAPPADRTTVPSNDPKLAEADLVRLTSRQDRQAYLQASGLTVDGMRKIAKQWGLRRYSSLPRPALVDLLVDHGLDQPVARVDEPPPVPVDPVAVDRDPEIEPRVPPDTRVARSDVDSAAVAARLREIETEDEGSAYLRAQHLGREGLLAVAAELQLTRVSRLPETELEERVLKQAIGARRKFAGLRRW